MSAYFPEETRATPESVKSTFLWISDLREVERFQGLPMIHRTTLHDHTTRVRGAALHIASSLQRQGTSLDVPKLIRLAQHHDDPEIITGDIPSPVKRAMSTDQRTALKAVEDQAALVLAKRYFPDHLQAKYLADYQEIGAKKTSEAQIVDLADKWEGLSETIHEIRCGNEVFYPVLENYADIFDGLKIHPLWDVVSSLPQLQLDTIPTPEEASQIPRVSLDLLSQGAEAFRRAALDPNVPAFYNTWRNISLTAFHTPGSALFPGWRNELVAAGLMSIRQYS
jgi:5'-deoxynucleotidase